MFNNWANLVVHLLLPQSYMTEQSNACFVIRSTPQVQSSVNRTKELNYGKMKKYNTKAWVLFVVPI